MYSSSSATKVHTCVAQALPARNCANAHLRPPCKPGCAELATIVSSRADAPRCRVMALGGACWRYQQIELAEIGSTSSSHDRAAREIQRDGAKLTPIDDS